MAEREIDNRFCKFGTVSFTGLTRVNDFIDSLEKGKVMGTKCKACGLKFFPPRSDCYQSLGSDMEWFEVTGTGTLLSFSTLSYAPVGFGQDLPYTIAVVDYGDYKVFGRVDKSIPVETLSVGMRLKTASCRLPEGKVSYVFQQA
jgi:uncharacterized OB-fold protein